MTLNMTSAQVVETSVNVKNNSSFQNCTNPDNHTQGNCFEQLCVGGGGSLFDQLGYNRLHTSIS